MITVSVLVATALLCLLPTGQRFISWFTRGLLPYGAMPWVALGAVFIWTMRVNPNPTTRGYMFGALVLAIAAAFSWWAPRNERVKGFIKNTFFGGRDVWAHGDYKMYVGALWGAGIMLAIPVPGIDAILNWGAVIAAVGFFVWQAYKGHTEVLKKDAEEIGATDSGAIQET